MNNNALNMNIYLNRQGDHQPKIVRSMTSHIMTFSFFSIKWRSGHSKSLTDMPVHHRFLFCPCSVQRQYTKKIMGQYRYGSKNADPDRFVRKGLAIILNLNFFSSSMF
jgi:hypothetical protein